MYKSKKSNKATIVMFSVVILGALLFSSFSIYESEPKEPTVKFMLGENSVLDRGYARYEKGETISEPAHYRWQNETWGECLYIYDSCATLKARVVNPVWVRLYD